MTKRVAAILTLSGLLLLSSAACGRYGKPIRSAPPEPPDSGGQEHAQPADKR
jgi:hypothetical protein